MGIPNAVPWRCKGTTMATMGHSDADIVLYPIPNINMEVQAKVCDDCEIRKQ